MFHANIFAGSKEEKTELWISSMEHQMAFFKPNTQNGEINGGWNPLNSNTSSTNHTKFQENFKESCSVYSQTDQGRHLDAIEFTGS